MWTALAHFGAPLENVSPEDFANADLVYQIGIEPNRIDILMGVSGLRFEEAWSQKVQSHYGDEPIFILSREDLIRNKAAIGRPQDRIDLESLKKAGPDAE